MTNKMTKRDYFNALLVLDAVASNSDLSAFIAHEIELLDKKNASRSGTLTITQQENIELGKQVIAYLTGKQDVTGAAIAKHFGLTSQKVTPLMAKLEQDGKVTRNTIKRVSYFTVVAE